MCGKDMVEIMETAKTISVNRWGNGLGIRLPKEFIDRAKITNDSQVQVSITDKGLLVTRAPEPRKHIPLSQRFKDYKGDYNGEVIDWGEDVGGEVCD
jgi:antitoxin MazE